MRTLTISVATVAALAAALPSQAAPPPFAGAALERGVDRPGELQPTDAVACVGWGWRGYGFYRSPLGARVPCWNGAPVVYGVPPGYIAPGYIAAPVVVAPPATVVYAGPSGPTWYWCQAPGAYYPAVKTCASGWRAVEAVPPAAAPPAPPAS